MFGDNSFRIAVALILDQHIDIPVLLNLATDFATSKCFHCDVT